MLWVNAGRTVDARASVACAYATGTLRPLGSNLDSRNGVSVKKGCWRAILEKDSESDAEVAMGWWAM